MELNINNHIISAKNFLLWPAETVWDSIPADTYDFVRSEPKSDIYSYEGSEYNFPAGTVALFGEWIRSINVKVDDDEVLAFSANVVLPFKVSPVCPTHKVESANVPRFCRNAYEGFLLDDGSVFLVPAAFLPAELSTLTPRKLIERFLFKTHVDRDDSEIESLEILYEVLPIYHYRRLRSNLVDAQLLYLSQVNELIGSYLNDGGPHLDIPFGVLPVPKQASRSEQVLASLQKLKAKAERFYKKFKHTHFRSFKSFFKSTLTGFKKFFVFVSSPSFWRRQYSETSTSFQIWALKFMVKHGEESSYKGTFARFLKKTFGGGPVKI